MYEDLARENAIYEPEVISKYRSWLIQQEIRLVYTLEDELAIMRKKDVDPERFMKFNNYVEECIKKVDDKLQCKELLK